MKTIAIKGHPFLCKKVIEILEMLGGKNSLDLAGYTQGLYYYINNYNIITHTSSLSKIANFKVFTVEEFFKQYPYKVGDKVLYKHDDKTFFIRKIFWENDKILYELSDEIYSYGCTIPDTLIFDVDVVKLQPYEEKTMETITIDDFKANTKEWLIDKLHGMIISKAIKTIGDIHEKLHKPQYPKTYKECCGVLCCKPLICFAGLDDDEEILYGKFIALKRCRDAYWKIAGEQMGLGKLWKPDWLDTNTQKYCIYYVGDEIKKQPMLEAHHFLAFPTAEMRDAFFENFKKLIEQCKEFL